MRDNEINLEIHSEIGKDQKVNFTFANDESDEKVLASLGVGIAPSAMYAMAASGMFAMDAAPAMMTTPSVGMPAQFGQYWDADIITPVFAKKLSDEIMPLVNAGSWEDVQIVNTVEEILGNAEVYTDYANPSNAQYNLNFQTRAVLRFQKAVQVGRLQEMQAAKMRYNAKAGTTKAASTALEILRNQVAFTGYVSGTQAVYGVLNDPNLPNYGTVSVGASGDTAWDSKTMIEIINDLRKCVQDLTTKLNGNFNPENDKFSIWLPVSRQLALSAVAQYTTGNTPFSVKSFIESTWKNCEIHFIPQFDSAVGGENVMYIVKDDIDGKPTMKQYITSRLFMVGFERKVSSTIELYSNSTAGVFVRYPIGVVRYIGI